MGNEQITQQAETATLKAAVTRNTEELWYEL
ncbi:MAG: hypothetical protein A4E65_00014 [Syntrophorhabdus sp. PtaU1.Bin153]|nr:MAG: hypothetical protein A4E65_00014 [Syntrophorhabdus sp. PtaU1.Bin153]